MLLAINAQEFFTGTSNENTIFLNIVAIILAVVVGTLYYYNMSASIPTESNCSFQDNVWTDILATGAGVILIFYGMVYCKIPLITFIVTIIVVEHFCQWYFNKRKE